MAGSLASPILETETAVDDMQSPGSEARLVAREIDDEMRDLLGGAQPSHRLAVDEGLAHGLGAALRLDAVVERGRLNGAGRDRVAAYALLDVVGGDRLGQPDDGRLGRAVDEAVGDAAHR